MYAEVCRYETADTVYLYFVRCTTTANHTQIFIHLHVAKLVSLALGEHTRTTSMNSRNDTESTMLHSATPCSSENTEVISGRDDKGLSVDHVEESDNPADVVREAVIPSKSTLPASATDDSGLSKPVEVATTLNDESAPITSTSSDGNNEIVLTFPQRVSAREDPTFTALSLYSAKSTYSVYVSMNLSWLYA